MSLSLSLPRDPGSGLPPGWREKRREPIKNGIEKKVICRIRLDQSTDRVEYVTCPAGSKDAILSSQCAVFGLCAHAAAFLVPSIYGLALFFFCVRPPLCAGGAVCRVPCPM